MDRVTRSTPSSPRSPEAMWLRRRVVPAAVAAVALAAGACTAQASLSDAGQVRASPQSDLLAPTIVPLPAPPEPAVRPPASPGGVLLAEDFDVPDGLVTNERAYWSSSDPAARASSVWQVTSGSLFAAAGRGWTGPIDAVEPDAGSSNGTNSAIFRLTTQRSDFGDVNMAFTLDNSGYSQTPATPAVAWDGVHVFLRHQSEESLYYVSVDRRDRSVVIKKKVSGGPSNSGTYYTLASARPEQPDLGPPQQVSVTVQNLPNGSVQLSMLRADGSVIVSAVDAGIGGAPITAAGRVGIRGDNSEFTFDDFRVTAAS